MRNSRLSMFIICGKEYVREVQESLVYNGCCHAFRVFCRVNLYIYSGHSPRGSIPFCGRLRLSDVLSSLCSRHLSVAQCPSFFSGEARGHPGFGNCNNISCSGILDILLCPYSIIIEYDHFGTDDFFSLFYDGYRPVRCPYPTALK